MFGGVFLPSCGHVWNCMACSTASSIAFHPVTGVWLTLARIQTQDRSITSVSNPGSLFFWTNSIPLCFKDALLHDQTDNLLLSFSQRCTANLLERWSRATWWLSRRLNMKLALTSTIYVKRISCWMDPRRSPAFPMAAGVRHLHTAEVKDDK